MDNPTWTIKNIQNLFRIDKAKQTLINAEERGEIPTALRVPKGKVLHRHWTLDQLPEIGKKFGFLERPKKQHIVCVFAPKGGVLKTSITFNFGRILALNGIKTLVIGLDLLQKSLTNGVLPRGPIDSLQNLPPKRPNLYHFFYESATISEIIFTTSLPTLNIIPEGTELEALNERLANKTKREHLFKDHLLPHLEDYEVIIFDNGPGWNPLVANSLTASKTVVCPMGCDWESFDGVDESIKNTLFKFRDIMELKWNFIQIATLVERNKLSDQIHSSYKITYPETLLLNPIRRTIKAQEARAFNQSVLEHLVLNPVTHSKRVKTSQDAIDFNKSIYEQDVVSSVADDYYALIKEVWSKINKEGF